MFSTSLFILTMLCHLLIPCNIQSCHVWYHAACSAVISSVIMQHIVQWFICDTMQHAAIIILLCSMQSCIVWCHAVCNLICVIPCSMPVFLDAKRRTLRGQYLHQPLRRRWLLSNRRILLHLHRRRQLLLRRYYFVFCNVCNTVCLPLQLFYALGVQDRLLFLLISEYIFLIIFNFVT